MSLLRRISIDRFLLALIATVALATLLPARGAGATFVAFAGDAAIVLLFFLHGAKLSRAAIVADAAAWRVHLLVVAATFVLFPLLGTALQAAVPRWVDPAIGQGLLFLTLLPSTVQSSIAFTAIARGNVPAAVCSASLSNLVGIGLTPLLVAWLIGGEGGFSVAAVWTIVLQLLLPFLAGHLSRPLTARFVERHKAVLSLVDRGSILLIVYGAFSAAVEARLWTRVGAGDLAVIFVADALLLAVVLSATLLAGRAARLPRDERIVVLFCGSKKSLVSGVPMAGALFPATLVGPVLLPLMLFHQMQLMACAVIANQFRRQAPTGEAGPQDLSRAAPALQ